MNALVEYIDNWTRSYSLEIKDQNSQKIMYNSLERILVLAVIRKYVELIVPSKST